MTKIILTIFTFIAVLLFPWPAAALLALATASIVPLVPLATGIFADALYYAPHASLFPHFTLWGALATVLVSFVRSRLSAGMID